MDLLSYVAGIVMALVFVVIMMGVYSAGKNSAKVEKMQSEHEEQKERVQSQLR